ncbi:hypothetical protein PoB_005426500 [Plakobranchus ocellatus]|uniref:Uncharacterized protein n=1 Tax=Plakobranchus ocellatus TaxID=259542 RepID=A0AAV4C501_9GAST|nr:hypothetical protein PoB_005426500 [Plakobranchus ocellatus]
MNGQYWKTCQVFYLDDFTHDERVEPQDLLWQTYALAKAKLEKDRQRVGGQNPYLKVGVRAWSPAHCMACWRNNCNMFDAILISVSICNKSDNAMIVGPSSGLSHANPIRGVSPIHHQGLPLSITWGMRHVRSQCKEISNNKK